MHGYRNPGDLTPKTLAPGVTARVVSGENLMFSLVTLEPGAVVPTHSHPHEQLGMMVSGTMELTIAGETRLLTGNEMYLVPGGVPHAAKAGPGGAVALDTMAGDTLPLPPRCKPKPKSVPLSG